MVRSSERFDHGVPCCDVLFHPLPFFGYVRKEDVVDGAVSVRFGVVAEVIDPAHASVLSDYAVLDMVIFLHARGCYLLHDRRRHLRIIFRVHHSFERVSGKLPELLRILAAEHSDHSVVHVQDLFRLLGFVYEKASRHVIPYFFNNRKGIVVQLKKFTKHNFAPYITQRELRFSIVSISSF